MTNQQKFVTDCGGIQPSDLLQKRNNTTELVFILDRSGSMAGLEADTIGGFNSLIEKQKKQEGKCYVSTVFFNHKSDVIHDRQSLENVRALTDDDYCANGCTALLDAMGDAIRHISNIHKYARAEDVPSNTMFVIMTDGMENASSRYSVAQIKALVEEKKEEYGWEFLFIGANIDAIEVAGSFGINPHRAVKYNADSQGTGVVYDTVAQTVCCMRANEAISDDWCSPIADDFENRK